MTKATTSLLDPADVLVSPGVDADALVRELGEVDGERQDTDAGIVWFLQHTPGEDKPCLTVGVRGDVGALTFYTATEKFVPAHGTNAEDVEYFFTGGHVFVMEPGTEIPIAQVHEAVREYVRTGNRPTCLGWVEAS